MNWKYVAIVTTLSIFLFSCTKNHTSIKEYVQSSDSVSIAFYQANDSTSNIIIHDKKSIEKLGSYIDGEIMEGVKCADSGSIWFYEGGKKKMQVDFGLNGDCTYFTYMMNDKIFTKTMSKDANNYLVSVRDIASSSLK